MQYTAALSTQEQIAIHSTSFLSKLSSWVSALGNELQWVGFIKEGRAAKCVQNPGCRRETPHGWSALDSILGKAKDLLPLLCPDGSGRLVIVSEDLVYLSFWNNKQPWLALGLGGSVDIKRLMAITGSAF